LLKQYIVDEKDSEIIITGFREVKENQSVDLERAKYIENIFSKHGIDIERMSINVNTTIDINKTGSKSIDKKKVEIKVI